MQGHLTVVRVALAAFLGSVAIVLLPGGVIAVAAEPLVRVYDPALSLTGDCSVTAEDPIPDPGCPVGTHPPKRFRNPCGVATDSYGDVYVASSAPGNLEGETQGRVDVFNAAGEYLTGFADKHKPCDLAVDSKGHVYLLETEPIDIGNGQNELRILLFTPPSYPPEAGMKYPKEDQVPVVERSEGEDKKPQALAIDPSDDHLYARLSFHGIVEYGSAAEELPGEEWTPQREGIGVGIEGGVLRGGFDVYGKNHDIYSVGFSTDGTEPETVFVIDGTTNEKKCETDGAATMSGKFSFSFGKASLAVDQASGDFYVDDTQVNKVVDRFTSDCSFVDRLPDDPPSLQSPDPDAGLAVDDPCLGEGEASCDLGGYHSPKESEGQIYVGSGEKEGNSHLFAFPLRAIGPPEVRAQVATDVTDTDAVLRAEVNPHALETTYRFEYIRASDYQTDGGEFGAGSASSPATAVSAGHGATFAVVSDPSAAWRPTPRIASASSPITAMRRVRSKANA